MWLFLWACQESGTKQNFSGFLVVDWREHCKQGIRCSSSQVRKWRKSKYSEPGSWCSWVQAYCLCNKYSTLCFGAYALNMAGTSAFWSREGIGVLVQKLSCTVRQSEVSCEMKWWEGYRWEMIAVRISLLKAISCGLCKLWTGIVSGRFLCRLDSRNLS